MAGEGGGGLDLGGGYGDDAFTTGDGGESEAEETSSSSAAGSGTREAPTETALSTRMKELGLDDDAAARLLEERHEEAAEESRQQQEYRIQQEAQQRVDREFPKMFPAALKQYITTDPGFRRSLRSMLDRVEGRSTMPGYQAQGGAQDDSVDPTTRALQEMRSEMHARVVALEERNAALEERLQKGAEAETTQRAYKETVENEIDGWARKNAALAQEYGEEIMGDLTERERQAGGRSFRNHTELRRYLSARADHYRKLDEKFSTRRVGGGQSPNRNRTTRPLAGNTGTPRGQATKREQTDLRVPAITAGVLEDMARYRDSGGE